MRKHDLAISAQSNQEAQQRLQTLSAIVLDRLPLQTSPPSRSEQTEVSESQKASPEPQLDGRPHVQLVSGEHHRFHRTDGAVADGAITSLVLRQRCNKSSWKPDAGSI